MTDFNYLLETVLLLAAPLVPVAVGVLLRRKFAPAEGVQQTGGQKAGRLIGSILFWGGLLGILFVLVLVLHFKGVF
ncbi:MAG: hypothetical protein ACYC2I_13520 [Elusimicrobiales bacterium]